MKINLHGASDEYTVMLRFVAGDSTMKTIVRVLAVAAAAAAASTALAGDRLSEAAYLKAAHCQGLAHAASLGAVDTTGIDALMREQGEGRDVRVRNQAKAIRAETTAAAESAKNKARLVNERDTRCSAWVQSTAMAASGSSAAR